MDYRAKKQKQQLKKKGGGEGETKNNNSWFHPYYKFFLRSLGRLSGCCCRGCRTLTLRVFLGRDGESCQNQLVALRNHPSLGRILRCVQGLCHLGGDLLRDFFLIVRYAGLLCPFIRIVGRKRVLSQSLFNMACDVGGCIILGGCGAWCPDCRG